MDHRDVVAQEAVVGDQAEVAVEAEEKDEEEDEANERFHAHETKQPACAVERSIISSNSRRLDITAVIVMQTAARGTGIGGIIARSDITDQIYEQGAEHRQHWCCQCSAGDPPATRDRLGVRSNTLMYGVTRRTDLDE